MNCIAEQCIFKMRTIVTHDPTSRDIEPQPAPGRGESTMLGARPT